MTSGTSTPSQRGQRTLLDRVSPARHHATGGSARLGQSGAPPENRTPHLRITNATFRHLNLEGNY